MNQAGPARRSLDLACGVNKRPGAIGMDLYPVAGVDVVADFDRLPLPFRNDAFDDVYGSHVIEHAHSLVGLLGELHRIAKPGARIVLVTPHYSAHGSWGDPTHRWHLSTRTFTYFGEGHGFAYYTHVRFRTVTLTVTFPSVWHTLGVQWLLNLENRHRALRFLRKFWEEYLSFVIRAKELHVVLEVVKHSNG
jgi:SAM-dependent methyltransferase